MHSGPTQRDGHWSVYKCHFISEQWYLCNDGMVTRCNWEDVTSTFGGNRCACQLLYVRVDSIIDLFGISEGLRDKLVKDWTTEGGSSASFQSANDGWTSADANWQSPSKDNGDKAAARATIAQDRSTACQRNAATPNEDDNSDPTTLVKEAEVIPGTVTSTTDVNDRSYFTAKENFEKVQNDEKVSNCISETVQCCDFVCFTY